MPRLDRRRVTPDRRLPADVERRSLVSDEARCRIDVKQERANAFLVLFQTVDPRTARAEPVSVVRAGQPVVAPVAGAGLVYSEPLAVEVDREPQSTIRILRRVDARSRHRV